MYKPLPDDLTIKSSDIEGLGLFAKEDIGINRLFGISHIYVEGYGEDGWVRTPLGGFFNHSDNPNCKVEEMTTESGDRIIIFYAIKNINAGEELTAKYIWYNPENEN